MKNLVSICKEIVEKSRGGLEDVLSVSCPIEILGEVKKNHQALGRTQLLEGVICSVEKLITLYPKNIWLNHCGLLPEPECWEVFEEEVQRVFAHEMRHLWQIQHERFLDEDAELDADEFAGKYPYQEAKSSQ